MKYPLIKNNINRKDLDLIIDHLKNDDPILTNGPAVKKFEKKWSDWLGVKYSIFVNSGASANFLSIVLLKHHHPEGGEVIVPTLTWSSDIVSVISNGFKPVFVDINPNTLGMSEDKVLAAISKKTKAIFLTHVLGFNGLSDSLISELNKKNIKLIEDVCESHGAVHKNKKLGSYGWSSNFSFYYAHHMTTIEGGMVCTNSVDDYDLLRMYRSHGLVRESSSSEYRKKWEILRPDLNRDFIFAVPGFNFRNTEIGGLIGLSQIELLDENIKKRNENFKYFLMKIDSSKYKIDYKIEGSSNYAFVVILKNKDDKLIKALQNNLNIHGIEYRRGTAGGGNQLRQPYIESLICVDDLKNYSNVEHVHFYGLYIGNYPTLTKIDIDYICDVINKS